MFHCVRCNEETEDTGFVIECAGCGYRRCSEQCHREHLTERRDGKLTADVECLTAELLRTSQTAKRSRRVLVVEDNREDLAETVKTLATGQAFNTDQAKIAIDWIRTNPHVALKFALEIHQRQWHGCECELSRLLVNYKPKS